jgi:hypothetical protein
VIPMKRGNYSTRFVRRSRLCNLRPSSKHLRQIGELLWPEPLPDLERGAR